MQRGLKTLALDVSNITTTPDQFVRTGIQEVIYQVLMHTPQVRQHFPGWNIVLLPRIPQHFGPRLKKPLTGSFGAPPPGLLEQVEESLRLPSREVWGFDLRADFKFRMSDPENIELMAKADRIHFQSYVDLEKLLSTLPSGETGQPRLISATIYDIIPLLFPEYFVAPVVGKWFRSDIMESFSRSASHLVCISRNTALDVFESEFGEKFEKISYLPLAFDAPGKSEKIKPDFLEKLGLKRGGYILALGSIEPRKNLNGLLQGFESWLARNPENNGLRLVIVGRSGWGEDEVYLKFRKSAFQDRVVFTGYLSDGEVAHLMQNSTALAMLSLYEGFGLPIAQAHFLGVTTITTLGSSLPEACLGSSIFVDPLDPISISNGIQEAVRASRSPVSRAPLPTWGWKEYTRSLIELLTS
jgi:glycosyltransferase involved in cell wall biosynthesis